MIDLFNEKMIVDKPVDYNWFIAKLLLIQAGIGPLNDQDAKEGDQYQIESFEMDKDNIIINNRGVQHILKAQSIK